MAVNKVMYGDTTLMDLTSDTVEPAALAEGYTAHDAAGKSINGTMKTTTVLYTEQSLTDAQKSQARSNIGAQPAGDYANKVDIPTKTSQLVNDNGYITQHQDLSAYAKKADIATTAMQGTATQSKTYWKIYNFGNWGTGNWTQKGFSMLVTSRAGEMIWVSLSANDSNTSARAIRLINTYTKIASLHYSVSESAIYVTAEAWANNICAHIISNVNGDYVPTVSSASALPSDAVAINIVEFGINSTSTVVGDGSVKLEMGGSESRPTYNGSNMALQSDIPTDYLPLIGGKIVQGNPSSDTTIASMNRLESDLFIEGNGSAPNNPRAAGFYLGKSATDDNRHLDIVSGDTYSYIDFNKASRESDYDVRLLINVENGDAQFMWGNDGALTQKVLNVVGGTLMQNGTPVALSSNLASYMPLSGGTLTGHLYGQYLSGTWLQTTATTNLGKTPSQIAVLNNGWVYYRTPAEIKQDLGGLADTNYTTLATRGSSLNSAEVNPTVNGTIAWTYK